MDGRLERARREARTGNDPEARARARREEERAGQQTGPLHGLVLVLGGRGSGKTVLLQAIERRHRRAGCTFVVWDRLGHWTDAPGRVVVRSGEAEEAARVAIAHAPTTLLLDEAALAFPSSRPPDPSSALNEIVKVGRQAAAFGQWARKGPVALVAAAQRPADVHPQLRNLVDRLYLGHFSAAARRDLDWVARATTPELAAKLPTLQPGQFIPIDCN